MIRPGKTAKISPEYASLFRFSAVVPNLSPATNSITDLVLNWNRSGEFNWLICSPTKLSNRGKTNSDRRWLRNGCFKIPLADTKKGKLPNGNTDLPLVLALSLTSNNTMHFSQLWQYLLGNFLAQCRLLFLTFAIPVLKGKIYLLES